MQTQKETLISAITLLNNCILTLLSDADRNWILTNADALADWYTDASDSLAVLTRFFDKTHNKALHSQNISLD